MFVEVLQNILNPTSLLLILAGVVLGNVFGAIPGLNTPIAIALVLPITMIMDPVPSVCLLMGIYMGGVSGGLVAAILLKIPGTAAAVATVFDGYPMAQKGEGTRALTIGAFASFFGGIFSSVMLLILAPLLSKIALTFGPWEYFGASILALSLVTVLAKGNMVKGCISLGIGLLACCVGSLRRGCGIHQKECAPPLPHSDQTAWGTPGERTPDRHPVRHTVYRRSVFSDQQTCHRNGGTS